MPRISDAREKIISRAGELLTRRGYNGFSYRDISTHLGVKNAAVHYHFPSKSDLALALINEFRGVLKHRTGEFMASGGSAREQMEGLFAFTEGQFCRGQCICPFGAFSIDYSELPEEVRSATREFMQESMDWLTRVLEVGLEQGEFTFEGDVEQRAFSILATLQGARQMARVRGIDSLQDIMQDIRVSLGTRS